MARSTESIALHLTLRWGDDILAVKRIRAGAKIVAGAPAIPGVEDGSVLARVRGSRAQLAVPRGAKAGVWRAGREPEIVEGPAEITLARGDAALLVIGEISAEVTLDEAEALPRGKRRAPFAWAAVALAALAHAVVLGLAAHEARASGEAYREDERTQDLKGLLAEAEQRAQLRAPRSTDDDGAGEGRSQNDRRGDGRAGGGAKASGEEGTMGDRLAHRGAHHRYAVPERAKKDEDRSPSRAEALADASTFGMIGLIAQSAHTPDAAFADPWAKGADAIAARGEMWARDLGDAAGAGGLGLTGIGEGGGGRGEGIGLGSVGVLGHTDGRIGPGTGGSGDRLKGRHRARPPRYCMCGTQVSGRLPPETIQRIIRQNFGRFRACYEKGLLRNPSLAGTVRARFVIGRSGAVESAQDGGSSMPDPAVTACVVRAFSGISFPQPVDGIVMVTYPIAFSPE